MVTMYSWFKLGLGLMVGEAPDWLPVRVVFLELTCLDFSSSEKQKLRGSLLVSVCSLSWSQSGSGQLSLLSRGFGRRNLSRLLIGGEI